MPFDPMALFLASGSVGRPPVNAALTPEGSARVGGFVMAVLSPFGERRRHNSGWPRDSWREWRRRAAWIGALP
jgi:hypothetical protein